MKAIKSPTKQYFDQFDDQQRVQLERLFRVLHILIPNADETIKWGKPTLSVRGKNVIHIGGFREHNSVLITSPAVFGKLKSLPNWCRVGEITLSFPINRLPPKSVLRQLVTARLTEFSQVTNGMRLDFSKTGRLRAEGVVKDSKLHGKWRWYRDDGSLMRTGQFRNGKNTGEWKTYDRNGRVVRTTLRNTLQP